MAGVIVGGLLKSVGDALAPLALPIALVVTGVVGAEAWEHAGDIKVIVVHVMGLGPQRDAQHLLAVTNATNWRSMKADRDAWKAAYGALQAQRQTEAAQATKAVSAAATIKTQASSDAFDQGYLAGRAMGRITCGAKTNAKVPPSGGDGVSSLKSGGVWDNGTDFRAQWQHGAYVPPGGVSGKS